YPDLARAALHTARSVLRRKEGAAVLSRSRSDPARDLQPSGRSLRALAPRTDPYWGRRTSQCAGLATSILPTQSIQVTPLGLAEPLWEIWRAVGPPKESFGSLAAVRAA